MPNKDYQFVKGCLLAGFAAVTWGGSAVVSRTLYGNALQDFDPLTLNFYRFLLGALVLNLCLAAMGRWGEVKNALRADWRKMLIAGLFGVTLEGSFQLWSLTYTTAGRGTLFGSSSPIFTLVFSLLLLGERARISRVIGAFCGMGGMVLLFFCRGADLVGGEQMWIGDILAMLSSVSWSIYTVTNSSIAQKYGGLICTCIMMPAGTLFLLPIVLVRGNFTLPAAPGSMMTILYLGLVSCGAAYLAWGQAGKYLSPGAQGGFGFVNLLTGLFLSVIFLHERLGLLHLCSIAIMMGGMYLMVRPSQKNSPSVSSEARQESKK